MLYALFGSSRALAVGPGDEITVMTMSDYDFSAQADPHANGTIWAAALWDLRGRLAEKQAEGGRRADLLLVQSLLLMGRVVGRENPGVITGIRKKIRPKRSTYTGPLPFSLP